MSNLHLWNLPLELNAFQRAPKQEVRFQALPSGETDVTKELTIAATQLPVLSTSHHGLYCTVYAWINFIIIVSALSAGNITWRLVSMAPFFLNMSKVFLIIYYTYFDPIISKLLHALYDMPSLRFILYPSEGTTVQDTEGRSGTSSGCRLIRSTWYVHTHGVTFILHYHRKHFIGLTLLFKTNYRVLVGSGTMWG